MDDWEIKKICEKELAQDWPYIGTRCGMHMPWTFLLIKFARDYRGFDHNPKTIANLFRKEVVQKEWENAPDCQEC